MMNKIRIVFGVIALSIAPFVLSADGDPPARVGRVSDVSGDVDFRPSYQDEPEAAVLNFPVTGGNVLATGPDGRVETRIGSIAIRAAADTELEFERLDDERIRLRLLRGSGAVRVRNADDAAQIEIVTPQGRVQPLEPGRYRIDTRSEDDRSRFSVFSGKARFEGPGATLTVRQGESLEVEGWETQRIREGEARSDDFDEWALSRDRRDDAALSTRYVSDETTGYEDLDRYGDWRDSADYGPVWVPRGVAADWAPYRYGRWVWVEPWGWTWLDDMPWGFAPFHYGRWTLVGATWGWVPGTYVRRPVYSPALVAWLGTPGLSLSIATTSEVGWFPLAPREFYVPPYRHSPTYIRLMNVSHVHDIDRVRERQVTYVYRDLPRAVTVVPARVVVEHRSVRADRVRLKGRREIAALPLATGGPTVEIRTRPTRPLIPGDPEADRRRRERWQERRPQSERLRAAVEQRNRVRATDSGEPRRTEERPGERLPPAKRQGGGMVPSASGESSLQNTDNRHRSAPATRDREQRTISEPGIRDRGAVPEPRRSLAERQAVERQRDEAQTRQALERQKRDAEQRQALEAQRSEAHARRRAEDELRRTQDMNSSRGQEEQRRRAAADNQRAAPPSRQREPQQRREEPPRSAGAGNKGAAASGHGHPGEQQRTREPRKDQDQRRDRRPERDPKGGSAPPQPR